MNIKAAFLLLLFSSFAHASDPLADVDPAIRNTLLVGYGETELPISTEYPEGFPPVALPDDLVLIGSRALVNSDQVAFETTLDEASVREEISALMIAAGWIHIELAGASNYLAEGFQSRKKLPYQNQQSYCAENKGFVSVQYSPAPKGTYVRLTSSKRNQPNLCEQERRHERHFAHQMALQIPVIYVPDTAGRIMGSGSGGDGDSRTTNTDFTMSITLGELIADFNLQLAAMGWI